MKQGTQGHCSVTTWRDAVERVGEGGSAEGDTMDTMADSRDVAKPSYYNKVNYHQVK